jgi:hypothetical protein
MAKWLSLGVAAIVSLAAAQPAATVDQLAWLSGTWVAESEDGWTEERWATPRGGVMLGTSLTGRGQRARGYEFMRIAADAEGRLTFWASPGGQTPVPFRLISASASEAVFENAQNDYPNRIVYRRRGNVLLAEISGAGGVNPQFWHYELRWERPRSRPGR